MKHQSNGKDKRINPSPCDEKIFGEFISHNLPSVIQALEALTVGALFYNRDFNIEYINDALCNLVGYSREETVGRKILDFIRKEDDRAFIKYLMMARHAGEISSYDLELTRSDGERIVLFSIGAPIYTDSGGFEGGLAFFIDITQRKSMESELKTLKSFNENIIESIPAGIIVLNNEMRITFANEVFLETLKISRREAVGEKISEIVPFHVLREKKLLRSITTVMETGRSSSIDDLRLRIAGRERIMQVRINPLHRQKSSHGCITVVMEDVTDVRNLQQQLVRSQSMESIGRLAGGIAHDFNNLLSGILGYASLLQESLPAGSEQQGCINMILNAGERATSLTGQLLTLASGGQIETRIFDPSRIIREVHRLLSRTIDKSIALEIRSDPKAGMVKGNETNLQQAVLNIAINARDAMPRGGSLRIESSAVFLDGDFCIRNIEAEPGEYVLIRIKDTGTGIDPSINNRIFEPFFTTKPGRQGTGLGLPIAYGIISGMGGFIRVDSDPGGGTTFLIYLPAAGDIEEGDTAPGTQNVPGCDERILVVDDEEMVRKLAICMLEEAGYRTISAADGRNAIDRFKESKGEIDLILLDLIMPNLGGGETFRMLRDLDESVPVIVISGFSSSGQAAEILKHQRTGFLHKPFSSDEILLKVRELLNAG